MHEPHTLNLRHLDALREIDHRGNISMAAAQVGLSQPALAQAVAKIERLLGAPLYARHAAGVSPTEAGRRFALRVQRALRYLASGVREIRRPAQLPGIANVERRVTMAQLRALVAVAGVNSYAAAAEQVGLSQPSLHRAMRELQQVLEVPLLTRSGRAVRATDAANRLVHFTRLMLAELRAGMDEVSALGATPSGHLRVGVLPVARARFLPAMLADFCALHPAASVEVIEGPYAELLARLRQGDMDLLIGSYRESVPARDVVQETLFDDALSVVGRAGHPLQGKRRLSTQDLLDHPWVVPARGVPMRLHWERMFAARGVEPPRLRVQCGSVMLMRGLMLEGDWLTLMSGDQFLLESQAGKLARIGMLGPEFRRCIAMTRRKDWRPAPLAAHFAQMLRDAAANR
ncbi:LysR family transcriptional regulator [Stenotrophomonas tumulicola]|uniref:LysR family transcriptional regulator n=1 Tax=Stenotrophomonas tumulicola TaxID=1685415 RepID=A0A7W3III8_9GAMM|nr:LysR family transcriptional regulator [Stenotrophomonas tumulicola]MBA8682251.1 LysR family transcriptional regulator [Stenotrophomonas tumulicola]